MRNKLRYFLHFLLFLFTAEDSSQWHGDSPIHAEKMRWQTKLNAYFGFH